MNRTPGDTTASRETLRDLGFGSRVMRESSVRLLNRDGTFNVSREGLPFFQSLHLYHTLVSISWTRFNAVMAAVYIGVVVLFAGAYILCGPEAIAGADATGGAGRFVTAFDFSVQTFTTVGYGHLIPVGRAANTLVAIESFLGLSGVAVVAALIFARVSRPKARVLFSKVATINNDRATPSFQFRIVNGGRNELINVNVRILLAKTEMVYGLRTRRFHELKMDRQRLAFFPLHWVVDHPITDDSPLSGMTSADLEASNAEFLVVVDAIDDTTSQVAHARSSYRWEDIRWNMRFSDMFRPPQEGRIAVDISRLHDVEEAGLPVEANRTVWG